MVQYTNLINALCKDIKDIINKEYSLFPIDKYKYSIPPNNKRAVSQNMFSRDTGNLNPKAISSVSKYNKLPKINVSDIRKELERIGRIALHLSVNNNHHKMISYIELGKILEKYNIYLNKDLIVQILRFLDIKNPNCFYIKEFVDKINKEILTSTNFNLKKNGKKNTLDNSFNSSRLKDINSRPQYSTLTEWNSYNNNDNKYLGKKYSTINTESNNLDKIENRLHTEEN